MPRNVRPLHPTRLGQARGGALCMGLLLAAPVAVASSPKAAQPPTQPVSVRLEVQQPREVKLVMVGDTGEPLTEAGCDFRPDGSVRLNGGCAASRAQREHIQAAIHAEGADAIFALGDLVYPKMPACDGDLDEATVEVLDASIGSYFSPMGAPTYLVIGNHDAAHLRSRAPQRERCLMAYAAQNPLVRMPALQYEVDVGFGKIIVMNSNLRDQSQLPAQLIRTAADNPLAPWTVVLSHHELRTLADKELDGFWEPPPAGAWLVEQRLLPDLWVNGHAHSLQLGVYDARATDDGRVSPSEGDQPWLIPALTTGAGSKVRPGPSCSDHPASPGGEHQIVADRKACKEQPARGMPRFSRSTLGYAVVRLGPWHLQVEIKDQNGELLYCWVRGKGDPGGATCPLDGVFEDQPEGGMQGRGAGALGG